jgi:hypothetical protein
VASGAPTAQRVRAASPRVGRRPCAVGRTSPRWASVPARSASGGRPDLHACPGGAALLRASLCPTRPAWASLFPRVRPGGAASSVGCSSVGGAVLTTSGGRVSIIIKVPERGSTWSSLGNFLRFPPLCSRLSTNIGCQLIKSN